MLDKTMHKIHTSKMKEPLLIQHFISMWIVIAFGQILKTQIFEGKKTDLAPRERSDVQKPIKRDSVEINASPSCADVLDTKNLPLPV